MVELSFIVGVIGNVISILVFLSPIRTFRKVVKKNSTESFKGTPYVTTLLSTSQWTFYGLLKPPDVLVVTVNGAGTVLQAIYVIFYLIYAPREKKVKTAKLVALLNFGFYGAVVLITLLVVHSPHTRKLIVGSLCAALTVGMYAAPLAAMRTVMRTKSVEYMPFFLSFFLFLNGGAWSVYSFLVKDIFIMVPNVIGFVLGTAQLIIYLIYRRKTPTSSKAMDSEKDVENGLGNSHEMQDYKDGKHHLSKDSSLPKPSIDHQNSNGKLTKSPSWNPYEAQSKSAHDK